MEGTKDVTCFMAFVLPLAGTASGQTINAAGGNARFVYNAGAVPTDGTGIGGGSSNLRGSPVFSAPDHLVENWWWYRVDGVDTREFRYHAPSNPFVASGDTMTGTFHFEHFSSDLRYIITDPDGMGDHLAILVMRNRVTNTSDAHRTIRIYSFADLNVGGESVNSYFFDGTWPRFQVSDSASPFTNYGYQVAYAPSAFQAGAWSDAPGIGVRGLLADDGIDDLDNTAPGSPGNFTGAFQWTLSLEPGASYEILAVLDINGGVPSPGSCFVLGGAATLAFRRRR